MKWVKWIICASALAAMATNTFGAETPAPIKIKSVNVSHPDNFHFRIFSSTPDAWLCANGPNNANTNGYGAWAYVSETDPGSKVMISTLLTAYALGKTVSLSTVGVIINSVTYCKIVEFMVHD